MWSHGTKRTQLAEIPVKDSNKWSGVSWHGEDEGLLVTQSAKIPPTRVWGNEGLLNVQSLLIHNYTSTSTEGQQNQTSESPRSTCHSIKPWEMVNAILETLLSPQSHLSLPCSLPAPGSVQENHTTWALQTTKPILFLAALLRKEVQACRKEFFGSKAQTWLDSANPISNFHSS